MSPNKVLYEFYIKDYSVGTWELVQAYSESPTLNWTPSKAGQYRIELHVKDTMSSNYFDSNIFKDVTVNEPAAKATGLTLGSEFYACKNYPITGNATSPNKVLYEFYIKDYSVDTWELVQAYSENPTLNWTPSKAGQYRIELHVKDINSSKYFDSNIFKDVTVNEPAAKATGLILGSEFYACKSSSITGNATSPNKVLYEYYVKDYSVDTWELVQAYSESPALNWTPSKAGQYRIELHVKDINSSKYFDSNIFKDVTINEPSAKATGLTLGSEFYTYKSSPVTGNATSPDKVLYEFYIKDYSVDTWELVQAYSENPALNWTPSKAGQYRIELHVKDINSNKYFDSNIFKDVTVNESAAKATGLTLDSEFYANKNAAIIGNATSPNKVLYEFYVKDYSVGTWELVQEYSENPTLNWMPRKAGQYRIELHVKDINSSKYFDSNIFRDVTVNESAAKATGLTLGSEFYAYKSSAITGSAASPNKTLYEFYVKDYSNGVWELVQAYSESPVLNWTPTKPGNYRVELHVKDIYSSKYFDDNAYKDILVCDPNIARNATISMDSNYNISATGISGNKVLYEFWVMNQSIGTWQLMQAYSESDTYSWKPDIPGRYRIEVHIKDINSSKYYDDNAYVDVTINGKTIILDAGHGGKDPGAVNGTIYEKNLNIQIVEKLGNILNGLGYNVIYTREPSKDVFIELDDRTLFSNSTNANLFLSIHHNSSTSSTANGVSAHYSSYRPEIETKDAYVEYNGRKYPYLYETTNNINGKLKSYIYFSDNGVTKSASIDDCTVYDSTPSQEAVLSGIFADKLVQGITSLGINKDGVDASKDHNLFVTRHTTMPSVLLEVGFMSNESEVSKISTSSFQQAIAQKIAEAIVSMF